jgi:hypothetical protein
LVFAFDGIDNQIYKSELIKIGGRIGGTFLSKWVKTHHTG